MKDRWHSVWLQGTSLRALWFLSWLYSLESMKCSLQTLNQCNTKQFPFQCHNHWLPCWWDTVVMNTCSLCLIKLLAALWAPSALILHDMKKNEVQAVSLISHSADTAAVVYTLHASWVCYKVLAWRHLLNSNWNVILCENSTYVQTKITKKRYTDACSVGISATRTTPPTPHWLTYIANSTSLLPNIKQTHYYYNYSLGTHYSQIHNNKYQTNSPRKMILFH